jgi:quinol monooxygenase YgiN
MNDSHVVVIAEICVAPAAVEELQRHFPGLIEQTRKEVGCIQYDLNISFSEPGRYVFVELWASDAALDAHLKSPHLNSFVAVTKNLEASLTVRTYRRFA